MLNICKYIPKLVPLYSEQHRDYHSLHHIHSLTRMIESKSYLGMIDPARVNSNILGTEFATTVLQFTAWFHDSYYDPYLGSPINEQYSNKIMEAMVLPDIDVKNTIDIAVYKAAKEAITATGKHLQNVNSDSTVKLTTLMFMDLDMHGFCDVEEFNINDTSIRTEYYNTHERTYLTGRKVFLETLLKKERIYYLYADVFEESARANITNAIYSIDRKLTGF